MGHTAVCHLLNFIVMSKVVPSLPPGTIQGPGVPFVPEIPVVDENGNEIGFGHPVYGSKKINPPGRSDRGRPNWNDFGNGTGNGDDTGNDDDHGNDDWLDWQGNGNGTDNGTDIDNQNVDTTGGLPWAPDASLSPEENLQRLMNYLASLLSDKPDQWAANSFLGNLFNVGSTIKWLFDQWGVDKQPAAMVSLIEKVASIAQSYSDTIFTTILNYQSWYLQQEYNSPLNQLKRLADAGLNSAFVYGNYSNTASSPSAPAQALAASGMNSGAGQAYAAGQQADATRQVGLAQAIANTGQAVASLVNAGVSSYKDIAEADNIKLMTPVQVATGIRNFKNLGVQFDYLSNQTKMVENDDFRKWFDKSFQLYQQEVANASQGLEKAQISFDSAASDKVFASFGGTWVEQEKFSADVRDKSGTTVKQSYTLDQLVDAWNRGGYDEKGNVVFDKDDMRAYADFKASSSINAGVPWLNASVKGGFGAGGQMGTEHSSQQSEKSGTSSGESQQHTQSSQGFDSDSQTLTVGSKKFVRVLERSRMSNKQYEDYMQARKEDLLKARDHYFELTTGERSRVFMNLQNFINNYASGTKSAILQKFIRSVSDLQTPSAQVGD